MPGFLPALGRKENGCGLLCSLVRSTDFGFFDNLGPFADLGLDIAIDPLGRVDVDRHSEIGNRCRVSGWPTSCVTSVFNRRTISRGVAAGATSANQVAASKPGSAASATVGISSAVAARCALVTASARSEPAFTLPMTAERFANI